MSLGKCFMHTLFTQSSVGLASSRRAQWPHLCYPEGSPDVVPTKTPGFLHHLRWRSSSFVEHFAQVLYTFLVFRALFSYRYLLVRRQSICILSLIFLCHRLSTDLSVWWFRGLSSFVILLSHRRTQIRCADSVIRILYSLFFAASGFLHCF